MHVEGFMHGLTSMHGLMVGGLRIARIHSASPDIRLYVSAADAVVVAVPLGVLKKGSIKFAPALPARKQEAIQRLGFGLLNKVIH